MINALFLKLIVGLIVCALVMVCLWFDYHEDKKEAKRKEISRHMRNRNVSRAANSRYVRYGDELIKAK